MALDTRLPFSLLQVCRQCLSRPAMTRHQPSSLKTIRRITTTTPTPAESPSPNTQPSDGPAPRPTLASLSRSMLSNEDAHHIGLTSIFGPNYPSAFNSSIPDTDLLDELTGEIARNRTKPAHHLHVYSTKHNTHLCLTSPSHAPILSKSTGNIGFRKSARGTYDAAYQLSAYLLGQIYEGGLLKEIQRLEVVLRGFGVGREAVTKALLGAEGRILRPKIRKVTDATRVKFGGTRSRKPRRLG